MKPIKEVTKQNPCPHCGKPDWCYSIGNLSVCNRDNPPADGWYQTNKTDRDGHFYYAPIHDLPEKQPKQSNTRTWEYLDPTGNKLVRVVRIDPQKIIWQEYWLEHPDLAKFRTEGYWVKLSQKDYDKGKCTQAQWELFNQLKEEKRQHIPIYRYHEIQKAISENKTIFIVEGESCADKLWELGIPATTNIGGSKKWRSSHTQDLLEGSRERSAVPSIVLCPDRDKPGVEHTERIYQDFPHAQWLYAFPLSPLWNVSLPHSNGLDIEDWIDELKHSYRLSDNQIVKTIYSSIENYRNLNSELNTDLFNQSLSVNNVNTLSSNSVGVGNSSVNKSVSTSINNHQQCQQMNEAELIAKLHEIIDIAPSKSTITVLFFQLSKSTGRSVNEIRKLYQDLIADIEKENDRPIVKQEIKQLLTLESTHLDLGDYLPIEMVKPLNHIAEILGSNSLSQLTALLPVVASIINPDTKLTLVKSSKFYARPIFYSAVVGESGCAKSPTIKIFTDPLTQYMQGKAENVYQHQLAEYEAIKADKSIDNKPPKPNAIEYYVSDVTSECLAQIINEQPHKGFLMYYDELSGLIKQNNAYRGGRGADQEKILSGRDGTGWKVNRKGGDRFHNSRSTYSILGAITPDILRQQMGTCQDESGYWARFCYSYLPMKKCKFPDNELNIDIYPMLCSLYENLERLPAYQYHLCPLGVNIYEDFFNEMEDNKINEPNQAMRTVYAKFKRVAGEIALLLQSLHKAFYHIDDENNEITYIDPEFVAMGVELAKRYISEIKAIYLRHEGSDEKNLSPIYSRIIMLSQRKGWLKARDLKQGDRYFRKLTTVEIRHHFQNLIDLGFGVIRGVGKAMEWCFSNSETESLHNLKKGEQKRVTQNLTSNKPEPYSYAYQPSSPNSELITHNSNYHSLTFNVDNVDEFVDNQNQPQNTENNKVKSVIPINIDNVDNYSNREIKTEKSELLKNELNNNKSEIIPNPHTQLSTTVNIEDSDSILSSNSFYEPSSPSDILQDKPTQGSELKSEPLAPQSPSLKSDSKPKTTKNSSLSHQHQNTNLSQSSINPKPRFDGGDKYEGLYAIVPVEYAKSQILVNLRQEKSYLIGKESGMTKWIKVPLSKVIEYRQK